MVFKRGDEVIDNEGRVWVVEDYSASFALLRNGDEYVKISQMNANYRLKET